MSNQIETKHEDHGQDHEKEVTIIVNGESKSVNKGEISFEEIVSLAYDGKPPQGENWVFTVTYRRGHGDKPEGTLVEGQSVKVKDGMIFNVTATDKS